MLEVFLEKSLYWRCNAWYNMTKTGSLNFYSVNEALNLEQPQTNSVMMDFILLWIYYDGFFMMELWWILFLFEGIKINSCSLTLVRWLSPLEVGSKNNCIYKCYVPHALMYSNWSEKMIFLHTWSKLVWITYIRFILYYQSTYYYLRRNITSHYHKQTCPVYWKYE